MFGKVLGLVLSLVALISAAFAVDSTYMRRAEAKDQLELSTTRVLAMQRDLSIQQERGKIENELQVIELELEFLTSQYQNIKLGENAKEELRDRKQYLRRR